MARSVAPLSWIALSLLQLPALVGAGEPQKGDPWLTPVAIDILPGEARNLVDPRGGEPVIVAVFGSAALDVQEIQPESLHLGGAPIVKDAAGVTHHLEDVNGDGWLDLVVRFAPREIQLGDAERVTVLEGTTLDGRRLRGQDAIVTVAAAVAAGTGSSGGDEKLPHLAAALRLFDGDPVRGTVPLAVLASDALDPGVLSLESVRVNGLPITRMANGELASAKDVNGDGPSDLVVTVSSKVLESERLTFSAVTASGRIVTGEAEVTKPIAPTATSSAPTTAPGDKAIYPFVIFINDVAPADHYPAPLQVSGVSGVVSKVRVTLNGIIHGCFEDLDVMLVAPNGQSLVLMSDVGGCGAPPNATYLTFDDFAPTAMAPGASPAARGSYRPANSGAGDAFPAPAPVPSGATSLSAFSGIDPNGEWKLYVVDDAAGNTGQIREGWTLDLVTTTQFCNPGSLAIPDSGAASPYPSTITVSGLLPSIATVSVTLNGLSHTWPDDLDVMLSAPGSPTPVMLMSDAGGNVGVSNLQLTFEDGAGFSLPDAGSLVSATYRPGNYEAGDVLPAPAPNGAPAIKLGSLRGTQANGTWSLWVSDDAGSDAGSIAGGWCLNLTTIATQQSCANFSLTIPAGAPGTTSGPASLYPLYLNVLGTSGIPTRAQVRFFGLTHTFPADLDMLLMGPMGRGFVLLSDAGGSTDVTNLDFTIDTAAANGVPANGSLGAGPYRPTDFDPGETWPSPAPSGPFGTTLPVMPAAGQWALYVNDDAGGDVGELAGGVCLDLTLGNPGKYCSEGPLAIVPSPPMTIPEGAPVTTQGRAYPYGSRVFVPEQGAVPSKIRVYLNGLTHTFPDDLDVMLAAPHGAAALLMSDAGGSTDVSSVNLVFEWDAGVLLQDSTAIASGTYQVSDYNAGDGDTFQAPAPGGPYGDLIDLAHGDPEGYWDLYVMDDAGSDVGSLQSWCVEIVPTYPAGEVKNLRWRDKATLEWDAALNTNEYWGTRGGPASLPNLLTPAKESCVDFDTQDQFESTNVEVPDPGTFFWYIVVGRTAGIFGPAGEARVGGVPTARSQQIGVAGDCP
ncbi:MAG TPA: hypothetical protein VFV75_01640 [Candidatus Polarisedimenticolaceae bacterium]|nr:hypothetical protein [Candidatus Polarisedimenticolaceae bacterium]